MTTALFFPAAIWLDNNALTDQGRMPVDVSREERSTEVQLANGKKMKYVMAVKHTFSMSWSWLPDSEYDTIDGGHARQKISDLLGDSSTTHTLRFYDRNGDWKEYTVFVNSYSESLTRRDPHTGTHFWEVSIEFGEQ